MEYMTFKSRLPKNKAFQEDWLNSAVYSLLDILRMYHNMGLTFESVIKRTMQDSMAGKKAWGIALNQFNN